jgi:hypothetical protein
MPPEDPTLRQAQSHHPREYSDFTYAYPVISRRSGGVSIGVNLNIDKRCNFDCPYCQVDRTVEKPKAPIDLRLLAEEVGRLLGAVDAQGVCRLPQFAGIPDESKRLRDIAVSGDGEPTMVPAFPDVCARLAGLQASRPDLDFKLVLITNSTLLDKAPVLAGIASLLSRKGEVWAKLDAGTEEWFQRINVSRISLDRIEANLVRLGRVHPYAIPSMFHGFDGGNPPPGEVDAYLGRLRRIRDSGSRILEVQLYTLARTPSQAACTPVSGDFLRALRSRIETEAGLPARVYGAPE